jgi:hypothetical protein
MKRADARTMSMQGFKPLRLMLPRTKGGLRPATCLVEIHLYPTNAIISNGKEWEGFRYDSELFVAELGGVGHSGKKQTGSITDPGFRMDICRKEAKTVKRALAFLPPLRAVVTSE